MSAPSAAARELPNGVEHVGRRDARPVVDSERLEDGSIEAGQPGQTLDAGLSHEHPHRVALHPHAVPLGDFHPEF
jgi:hypothetical protein